MYRVIIASKSFEDLHIKTYALHTESAPTVFDRCSEERGQLVRQQWQEAVIRNRSAGVDTHVPLDSLVTDQIQNKVADLKAMYEKADSVSQLENISEDLPVVVQYEGVNYLLDGNTRAMLIYYLGGDTLKCRFFKIS